MMSKKRVVFCTRLSGCFDKASAVSSDKGEDRFRDASVDNNEKKTCIDDCQIASRKIMGARPTRKFSGQPWILRLFAG